MNIFDFLKNNIGFVIVIGGFLLTMLSRQRAKNGDPRSNPKMPSFGGSPDGSEPGQWIPGRKSREATLEPREVPKSVVPEVYRREEPQPAASRSGWERPERLVSSGTEAVERGGLVSASNRAAEAAQLAETRDIANSAAAEEAFAETVRRGVIWAEILGPPRAKQPYSHRK
jgi:hypothetical protein